MRETFEIMMNNYLLIKFEVEIMIHVAVAFCDAFDESNKASADCTIFYLQTAQDFWIIIKAASKCRGSFWTNFAFVIHSSLSKIQINVAYSCHKKTKHMVLVVAYNKIEKQMRLAYCEYH